MSAEPAQPQPQSELERWVIFGSVVLAAWGYAAAVTIGNALLPQIQGDLSASLDQVSWVVTASVVAGAIGIPPTPWLAARFGQKNVLVASLVLFAVSSAMISLAGNIDQLVLARICQAFFGAPIMVLSQSLTVSLFPAPRRGLAMAIWSVALTTGWVFGPALGAYLADTESWRLSFSVVIPISVLSVFFCLYFVPRSELDKALRFDWLGFCSLSAALLAIQLVLNRGQREDWFESTEIVAASVVGTISALVYVWHTLASHRRFIRWQIFRDRNFAVGMLLTAIFGFISLAPLVLIPPMLEQLKGLDVVTIGLLITPRGLAQIPLMLLLGPFVARCSPRLLIGTGFLCYALASWMMSNYTRDIGIWDLVIPQLLQGVTVAFVWLPVFHLLYLTLPDGYRNDASMLNGLVYNLISSAGVAALIVILSRSLQINTAEIGAQITLTRELLRFPEYEVFDLKNVEAVAALHAEVAQQAMMIGYVNVFWLLTWIALAALPILLFIPSRKHNERTLARMGQEAR